VRNILRGIKWETLLASTRTEENWKRFKGVMENVVNDCIPFYKNHGKPRPRWMTKEIMTVLRRKKTAWTEYKLYPSAENAEKYRGLEKEARNKIRKAKRKMERDLTKEDDSRGKNFSKYIKSKMKSKTGIGPLKDVDGQLVSSEKEMAKILNSFFYQRIHKRGQRKPAEKRQGNRERDGRSEGDRRKYSEENKQFKIRISSRPRRNPSKAPQRDKV
jgi:hypothetical protein